MADSVGSAFRIISIVLIIPDRVFAHAVNTVKKIPRAAGSSRPPLADRLLLYGLYKQATEGDIPGIVPRPGIEEDDAVRAKWDSWNSQRGISKTEAKRRYISSLIDNMTKYATSTPEARELVLELSFVWDQIKNQSPQQQDNSSDEDKAYHPSRSTRVRRIVSRREGITELEPRSQDSREDWEGEVFSDGEADSENSRSERRRFRRRMLRAIEALRADVAALCEEMEFLRTRNETLPQPDGILLTLRKWIVRLAGFLLRHALFNVFIAILVWSYLYRRGDDRVRLWGRIFSEWIKRRLNSRSRGSEIIKNRVSV